MLDPKPEPLFDIAVTSSSARPRYTMKQDDTFLVLDSHGDVGASTGGPDGLFHLDTRYLSRFELLINDVPPLLLGSTLSDDNCVLRVDLTNPDFHHGESIALSKNLLHIARTLFISRDTFHQRLTLHNYGAQAVQLLLSLAFASDFADLFEVRGVIRPQRGLSGGDRNEAGATLTYTGMDEVVRRTHIAFDPKPLTLTETRASYRLDLSPHSVTSIHSTVACDSFSEEHTFLRAMRRAHLQRKQLMRTETEIHTSNHSFNEMLRRATADLAMLLTETPQGYYPYAGIPWFSTTFGRDGLIVALQCLWLDRRFPIAVLRRLAATQACAFDPASDAAPGKILHEMRAGEMANLNEVPFGRYYGSVDSTPLFVLLAGQYVQATGDVAALRELWPAMERALGWIDGPGDPDQDGLVEYYRQTDRGLINQGWKDSHDSVFHSDGRLAKGPIAMAEVQGYVYAAKKLAAWCAKILNLPERAQQLGREADVLAERFEELFWCEDLGTYALALDADNAPCRVRSSNAGQVLFSGIARPERARRIAATLMQPDSFSGWGIRTISAAESRYNPMSYHNGSVWPHDNSLIALGLARYRAKGEVTRIFSALFDAASYLDLQRLPELFCGFPRLAGRGPTGYPVACAPQAWSAGSFFALLQASLGIVQDPWKREVRFIKPTLPKFIDEVTLKGLRVGEGAVDVLIRRHGERTALEVLGTRGHVDIITEEGD